ncbi:hypothetical protein HDV06_003574 [Boothiomyces sp. JEL0866]|nr:hypothetical protein HDV06_003574 [Boothiomyces sp. JEL0866]
MQALHDQYGPKESWIKMWEQNQTPWNMVEASLGLQKLEKEKRIPNGKILIPGCGQGLDAFYLSNDQRSVVGLDLYPKIVEENNKKRDEKGLSPEQLNFVSGDFFQFKGQFNVVFDYTFLCALDPSFRTSWADQMQKLIVPGGTLITLMFPLDDHEGGPPFALSVEIYHQLLDEFFECKSIEDTPSFERRKGKEKLGVWIRK